MRGVRIENAALVIMAVCATVVTFLVVRREFSKDSGVAPFVHFEEWQKLSTAGHNIGGSSNSKTMVVFSDFQCPFCRKFIEVVDSVRTNHPDVRIIERNFPLTEIHSSAFAAALASECAAESGKYETMRRTLYANQELLARGEWGRLASIANVPDTASLSDCVTKGRWKDRVTNDMEAGRRAELPGTPAVFLNDIKYNFPPSYAELHRAIQSLNK